MRTVQPTCRLLAAGIGQFSSPHVRQVYTMWENLQKRADMDTGTIGFHNNKEVRAAAARGSRPQPFTERVVWCQTSSGTSSWRRRTRNASSGWSAQRLRKNLISKVSRSMVCAPQACARLCVTTWRMRTAERRARDRDEIVRQKEALRLKHEMERLALEEAKKRKEERSYA